MMDDEVFDSAELIPADEIPYIAPSNPSNQSQQIVNFIQFNSPNTPDISKTSIRKETIDTVIGLYNDMNSKYGFNLEFDITSLTNNFQNIVNPKRRKLFEIYLSEAFGISRLVFFQRGLLTIMTLMEQISSPMVLSDPSIDLDYKFQMMERLMNLMKQFESMYSDIKVEDVDIQLRHLDLNDDQSTGSKGLSESPEVLDIMKQLNKIILKDGES